MPTKEKSSAARSARLRELLHSPHTTFLMEAHDGLSAKIVGETGFEGIWASGLSMSAAMGVRDANEASWTQILDILEFMTDSTHLPILVDGDTGHGNFNTVRRFVKKLCQRHIAGVCLEDKTFPKINSFAKGKQPLADTAEFQGKIRAAKDSQTEGDFCVVARCEALISGRTLEEALERCERYREAGADAILIHSKAEQPDEILEFANNWGKQLPLVIVPTMYWRTPTEVFEAAGISTVIWANHTLRASVAGMQRACRSIFEQRSVGGIEHEIAPIAEIFRLTNQDELHESEARYLPAHDGEDAAPLLLPLKTTSY